MIVAVVSLVQTVYVPKIMEQQEAEHMDIVADQFSWLKSSIDGLIASNKSGTSVVSSIKLGSRELPYLLSVRAFGSIEIFEDSINVVFFIDESDPVKFELGYISYESINAYFLNQNYIYENGCVIISQDDGEMMYINPSFFNMREILSLESLFVNLIDISVVGEKSSVGGYGTYPIQTEFNSINSSFGFKVNSIEIETSHADSWKLYFNNLVDYLSPNFEFYVGELDSEREGVKIVFVDENGVDLKVNYINILAQVGPGWVE